jgi:hypothetical protein
MKGQISTGSIFRFKLPIRGYGYCRLVHFAGTDGDIYLVKVYDYEPHEKLTSEDLKLLTQQEYLLNPLLLNHLPLYNQKSASWTLLGNLPMPDDHDVPDFKYTNHSIIQPENQITEWYSKPHLGNKTSVALNYDHICHLEHFHFYSPEGIAVRVAMEILRRENKMIQTYFDLRIEENLVNYYRTMNMLPYAKIPHDIRGKAIQKSKD